MAAGAGRVDAVIRTAPDNEGARTEPPRCEKPCIRGRTDIFEQAPTISLRAERWHLTATAFAIGAL